MGLFGSEEARIRRGESILKTIVERIEAADKPIFIEELTDSRTLRILPSNYLQSIEHAYEQQRKKWTKNTMVA